MLTVGIALCATTAEAANLYWDGKKEITSNVREDNLFIAYNADAVVYQDGHVVSNKSSNANLGDNDHIAAYILKDGTFAGTSALKTNGRYLHLRQMGGTIHFPYIMHLASKNTANTLPYDLVFGGSSDAYFMFFKGDGSEFKECNMVRQAKLGRANRMKGVCTAKKTKCR